MTESSWDEQFRQFLRKTGDDFRRASEEVRAEAQRLVEAAMDAEKQQRVRDRLNELTEWAKKTAHGVAGAVEDAAVKAESVFFRTSDGTGDESSAGASSGASAAPAKPARKPARKAAKSRGAAKARKTKKSPKPKKASRAKPKRGGSAKKKSAKRKR